jgi:hypothetical protein
MFKILGHFLSIHVLFFDVSAFLKTTTFEPFMKLQNHPKSFKTVLKRLDQCHLNPKLEVPGLTCPSRESKPGLEKSHSISLLIAIHLHMSARPVENARDGIFKGIVQPFELGGVARLILSAVKNWRSSMFF